MMKVVFFASLLLSLTDASALGDHNYDPLVVHDVDGLVEAMHAKYSKIVDDEYNGKFDHHKIDDKSDHIYAEKVFMKAEYDRRVLKHFRMNALEIVSSAIKSNLQHRKGISKRNDDATPSNEGNRNSTVSFFSNIFSKCRNAYSTFVEKLQEEGSIPNTIFLVVLNVLTWSAILYFLSGVYMRMFSKPTDTYFVDRIQDEIVVTNPAVSWDEIVGLQHAKNVIKEVVIWPILKPELFQGIRTPPKGLLLFGPPGNGKTLIGKLIASKINATFFGISASSLVSKWHGEGEQLVKTLFSLAKKYQPSVIFMDEIDSLLSKRSADEHEAMRRLKTEFLLQYDGVRTHSEDKILVIGATNRPNEIDTAMLRRFRKKLHIPLPDDQAREAIIHKILKNEPHSLTTEDIKKIVVKTKGYSGSDMDGLVREAAMGPLREITDIETVTASQIRPISFSDFTDALLQVRASIPEQDLDVYHIFEKSFGSIQS